MWCLDRTPSTTIPTSGTSTASGRLDACASATKYVVMACVTIGPACRWVFALYYPQDTPIELGPTAILRGCHNLMGIGSTLDNCAGTAQGRVAHSAFGMTAESGFVDPRLITEKAVPDHPKQSMVCPAGTVAFIHMDSWHGAGANILKGAKRYMLKFHYVRMKEPCLTGPTWDHDPSNRNWVAQTPDDLTPRASRAMWDWLCGGDAPTDSVAADERDTISLMVGLDGSETQRVDSALALGALPCMSHRS
jgi:hypothetical protein